MKVSNQRGRCGESAKDRYSWLIISRSPDLGNLDALAALSDLTDSILVWFGGREGEGEVLGNYIVGSWHFVLRPGHDVYAPFPAALIIVAD